MHLTTFGTTQLFFFWLFLLGGPLNWTMLKYTNVPKKCRKEVVDTNTGNKSGRCGGGTRATLTTLRPAMAATLMKNCDRDRQSRYQLIRWQQGHKIIVCSAHNEISQYATNTGWGEISVVSCYFRATLGDKTSHVSLTKRSNSRSNYKLFLIKLN